jgi:hypothetical protein
MGAELCQKACFLLQEAVNRLGSGVLPTQGHGLGQGQKLIHIRRAAADIGLLHPTGAEQASEGRVAVEAEQMGGVTKLAHNGNSFLHDWKRKMGF